MLTLLTLAVIAFLALTHKRHAALLVAVSVAGGTILSQVLKWGFDRPRPDLVPHGMSVYSQSFPSGHSMLAAVVYLTLAALLARTQKRTRVKLFLLGAAAIITVIVGISRIYLGVHWPTDVVGGWALGAAWASSCWLVMLFLQRKGEVEAETDGGAPKGSERRSDVQVDEHRGVVGGRLDRAGDLGIGIPLAGTHAGPHACPEDPAGLDPVE